MAYHADAIAAVAIRSYGSLGGGLWACVDFKRSNMSVSSSIQACLEFASAALISSGFATESRGGRLPRMIVKFAALVAEIGEVRRRSRRTRPRARSSKLSASATRRRTETSASCAWSARAPSSSGRADTSSCARRAPPPTRARSEPTPSKSAPRSPTRARNYNLNLRVYETE